MPEFEAARTGDWPLRLLLLFCRRPGTPDYPMQCVHYADGQELDRLREAFPDIDGELRDKVVVDFGCGLGYQCAAFALAGARRVIGVDTNIECLDASRRRVAAQGVQEKVSLTPFILPDTRAHVIVSQNSFEHFLRPSEILSVMRDALVPDGKIFITFAPPWYSAWGAHLVYFCRLPWAHLLFPERTVMAARSLFRSDGVRNYEEAGLAKMSLAKFNQLVEASGLRCTFKRYRCSWGLNWLQYLPLLRELFVQRVSCILEQADVGQIDSTQRTRGARRARPHQPWRSAPKRTPTSTKNRVR